MEIKAIIIIRSRKQMRNADSKPRVHAVACCLHEACSVYMSVCMQVFVFVCLSVWVCLTHD